MKPCAAAFLRRWVVTWTVLPLALVGVLLGVIELTGHLAGSRASGWLTQVTFEIGFAAVFVPIVAAHFVFFAAVVGLIGIAIGVRPNWIFALAISTGLVTGGYVLQKLYL
ncbi:MAG: hypothetical protein JO218_14865 [Burkholderiales bacterium]|nr:hypothetical protein [Burkholderiales bacterium]